MLGAALLSMLLEPARPLVLMVLPRLRHGTHSLASPWPLRPSPSCGSIPNESCGSCSNRVLPEWPLLRFPTAILLANVFWFSASRPVSRHTWHIVCEWHLGRWMRLCLRGHLPRGSSHPLLLQVRWGLRGACFRYPGAPPQDRYTSTHVQEALFPHHSAPSHPILLSQKRSSFTHSTPTKQEPQEGSLVPPPPIRTHQAPGWELRVQNQNVWILILLLCLQTVGSGAVMSHIEPWFPHLWHSDSVLRKSNELLSVIHCTHACIVYPKGNQPWMFIGRTDAKADAPILWPPDVKNWFIGKKTLMLRKIEGRRRRGWQGMRRLDGNHHLNGLEFEQTPGDREGQASLACCSPWGRKELDTA